MAKIITRFSIYTTSELELDSIASSVPFLPNVFRKKGDDLILKNGKNTGRQYKESSIEYYQQIDNVTEMEVAYLEWFRIWDNYADLLKGAKKLGFSIQLLFEVIIENSNTPAFYFSNDTLKYLSDLGIDLALDLYLE